MRMRRAQPHEVQEPGKRVIQSERLASADERTAGRGAFALVAAAVQGVLDRPVARAAAQVALEPACGVAASGSAAAVRIIPAVQKPH